MLKTVDEMTAYFRDAVQETKRHPREGLIHSLLSAEIEGDRLTEEEVVANTIITMVGGQETTTNLIGNGVLTLLRHPDQMRKTARRSVSDRFCPWKRCLRFESPSQHTARLAPSDRPLGGKQIRKRQAVIAVMAAANRDPERFPEPDRFDVTRRRQPPSRIRLCRALLFRCAAGAHGRSSRIHGPCCGDLNISNLCRRIWFGARILVCAGSRRSRSTSKFPDRFVSRPAQEKNQR